MGFEEAYVEFGEEVLGLDERGEELIKKHKKEIEFGSYCSGLGKYLAVYSKDLALLFEKEKMILLNDGRISVERWDYVIFSISLKGSLEMADEIIQRAKVKILDESEFGDYYEVISPELTLRFYMERIEAIVPRVRVKEGEKRVRERVLFAIP